MEGVRTVKNKLINIFGIINLIVLFLTGCYEKTDDNRLKIVTTIFPQYDFASHITGDKANITMLLTPGSESHTYEPSPSDIAKIQQADLFIYNGGESEVWVDEILKSTGNDKINTMRLMDYIEPLEEIHNDNANDHEHEYDEHIFTSLKNADLLLNAISEEICDLDKSNSSIYKENTEKYSKQITELDKSFEDMINSSKRKTVVFGDRFPFRYFAEDYDLLYHAAFFGCSSETEASSAAVSQLITYVKENDIPIIFYIEFSSQKTADKIAEASGSNTALLHSCHNISKEDIKNKTSYIDIMQNNFENLSEALN